MKKYIALILTTLIAALSCTQFDDSAIWEELLNHNLHLNPVHKNRPFYGLTQTGGGLLII